MTTENQQTQIDLEEKLIKGCLEMLRRPIPGHMHRIYPLIEECDMCQSMQMFGFRYYYTKPDYCATYKENRPGDETP